MVTWGWDFWWFTDSMFNTAGTNTIATISLYTTVWKCDMYIYIYIYTTYPENVYCSFEAGIRQHSLNGVLPKFLLRSLRPKPEVYLKQIVQAWTGVLTWRLNIILLTKIALILQSSPWKTVWFKAFSFVWKTSEVSRWRYAGGILPVIRDGSATTPPLRPFLWASFLA